MYEYRNGTIRLMGAIKSCMEDPGFVRSLSEQLRYLPEQLVQDVQALDDYVSDHLEAD